MVSLSGHFSGCLDGSVWLMWLLRTKAPCGGMIMKGQIAVSRLLRVYALLDVARFYNRAAVMLMKAIGRQRSSSMALLGALDFRR